jgi:hypothetical protein
MSRSDATTHPKRDRLIVFVAGVLPATNLAVYCLVRFNGGAHGHGPELVAAVVAAELAVIVWFCMRMTARAIAVWAPLGLLIDIAASTVAIYVLVFALLIVGYSTSGGGN